MNRRSHPTVAPGDLAAGVAAGVLASAAVVVTQAAWGLVWPPAYPGQDPTATAAVRAVKLATGHPLPARDREVAGSLVHYVVGATLGAAYAAVAPKRCRAPGVAVGFGLAVWLVLDETGLALLGLKPPPWRVALPDHAKSLVSHLAFGATLGAALDVLARPRPAPSAVAADSAEALSVPSSLRKARGSHVADHR